MGTDEPDPPDHTVKLSHTNMVLSRMLLFTGASVLEEKESITMKEMNR